MLNLLLILFGKLAGNGRAWMLTLEPIRSIVESLLMISENANDMFKRIPDQALPWLCDDTVIPLWELHFGLKYNDADTLETRRDRVIAEYLSSGGQAAEYIQFVLRQAGFTDLTITENLTGEDKTAEWNTATIKINNGLTYFYVDNVVTLQDFVKKPMTAAGWRKVFFVDVFLEDVERYQLLRELLLKHKPADSVAVVLAEGVASLRIDESLVTDVVDPVYALDGDLVTESVPAVIAIDGNLVFL